MKGYRITFIRHGSTQGNIDGKYIGVTDLPLSEQGADEMYRAAELADYPSFQKIYISPLKRCLQSAYILSPNSPMVELNELKEMNFGRFEGKTPAELQEDEDYKKFLEGGLDNPAPGGESAREVMTRCFEAITLIIGDMMEEGLTNCAVITHSGIIMNMMGGFGVPKQEPIKYACGFGEGFEVLVSASMWQRSGAFEIVDTFPPTPREERAEYFINLDSDESEDK